MSDVREKVARVCYRRPKRMRPPLTCRDRGDRSLFSRSARGSRRTKGSFRRLRSVARSAMTVSHGRLRRSIRLAIRQFNQSTQAGNAPVER